MRRTLAAATIAASVTMGGLMGSVLGAPAMVGAAESAQSAASWVSDTLSGLVADGTLTQQQADAVGTALEAARPEPSGGRHGGGRMDLSVVAEALGLGTDELRTELDAGQTMAEIASARGVDVTTVIDAIVTAQRDRMTEKVTAGELTQEQADAKLADAEARATALVNGEMGAVGGPHRNGGGPDRMPAGGGGEVTPGTAATTT